MTEPARKPEVAATRKSDRRLDIQGMRGLAIIPGFIFHMTGNLPGAVVFMDMFFTVSGYLITARLIPLAQSGKGPRHYFWEFYRFRVRRLLPASLATLALTVVVAWLLFVPSRAEDITRDAGAALFFFANIRYAIQGTDYMHHGEAPSPLLPFWSLSVEEQFYLVWPMLVLGLCGWALTRRRQRTALTWAFSTVMVVSFTYGYWFTATHPVAAYYDTPSRTWEFAFGGLLAVYAMRDRVSHDSVPPAPVARLQRWAGRLRNLFNAQAWAVSWAGTLIYILCVVALPTGKGFPVPWSALGVAGTALIIFSGIDQRPTNGLLTSRLFTWLGDLSYSIYLIHFPIMIFAASYLSDHPWQLYAFDVAATMVMALVLYYFVEEPCRRSWKSNRRWFGSKGHRPVVQGILVSTTAAAMILAITPRTPTGWAVDLGEATSAPAEVVVPHKPPAFDDPNLAIPTPKLKAALVAGLRLTAWPKISNTQRIEDVGAFITPCESTNFRSPACVARPTTGTDPAKVVVALGDSTMLAYWPMLRDALVPQGWTVVMFAKSDCPAGMMRNDNPSDAACRAHQRAFRDLLDTWRPSLVLMTSSQESLTKLGSVQRRGNGSGADAPTDSDFVRRTYVSDVISTTALIRKQSSSTRVALVAPPPPVEAPKATSTCLVPGRSPRSCIRTPMAEWYELNGLDRQIADDSGVNYVDTMSLLCVNQACPPVVEQLAVMADFNHITPEFATLIAPSFAATLRQRGLVD